MNMDSQEKLSGRDNLAKREGEGERKGEALNTILGVAGRSFIVAKFEIRGGKPETEPKS